MSRREDRLRLARAPIAGAENRFEVGLRDPTISAATPQGAGNMVECELKVGVMTRMWAALAKRRRGRSEAPAPPERGRPNAARRCAAGHARLDGGRHSLTHSLCLEEPERGAAEAGLLDAE